MIQTSVKAQIYEFISESRHVAIFSLGMAFLTGFLANEITVGVFAFSVGITYQSIHAYTEKTHKKSLWAHPVCWCIGLCGMITMSFGLPKDYFTLLFLLGLFCYESSIHAFAHNEQGRRFYNLLGIIAGVGLAVGISYSYFH